MKHRRHAGSMPLLLNLFVVLVLAMSISVACSESGGENGSGTVSPTTAAPTTDTTTSGNVTTTVVITTVPTMAQGGASPATAVAEALGPSVVNIDVADAQGRSLGLGSGVIFSEDGMIVTNNHVVVAGGDQPAAQFSVTLATGEDFPATLVGRDAISDLAVVKIDKAGLPAATFLSDLSGVHVGDYAVAIGTPLGLEGTVTLGIVSAVRREIAVPGTPGATDYIQTDAAISPGNSGGALADAQGRVIGINVAGFSTNVGAQNIGFAIPSDLVLFVVEQILAEGRVRYSYFGVQTSPITGMLRQQYNLGDTQGIVVLSVEPGGPADSGGIQPGDIIVAVGGKDVTSPGDLFSALRENPPGQQVEVRIIRAGQEQALQITPTERPVQ